MNIVVFVEGGIVQAVVDLDAEQPQKGIEYEVVDYDVLETEGPQDVKEYFDNRPEAFAYIKRHLPNTYAYIKRAMRDGRETVTEVLRKKQ